MGLPGSGLPRFSRRAAYKVPGLPYFASGYSIRRPVCPRSRPDRLSGAGFALGRARIVYRAPGSSIFSQNTSILAPSCLCLFPSSLFWRRILYLFPTLSMFAAEFPISGAELPIPAHVLHIREQVPEIRSGAGHRFASSPPQCSPAFVQPRGPLLLGEVDRSPEDRRDRAAAGEPIGATLVAKDRSSAWPAVESSSYNPGRKREGGRRKSAL